MTETKESPVEVLAFESAKVLFKSMPSEVDGAMFDILSTEVVDAIVTFSFSSESCCGCGWFGWLVWVLGVVVVVVGLGQTMPNSLPSPAGLG